MVFPEQAKDTADHGRMDVNAVAYEFKKDIFGGGTGIRCGSDDARIPV